MNSYEENHKTWDSLAQAYEEKFMNLTIYDHSYDQFCDLLPNTKEVAILETGCGPGNITRYIQNRSKFIHITATDISEKMIARAKEHVPEADFKVMDCRNISSLGKQFHGIVSGFCIPYLTLEDTQVYLNTCSDILHTNGILYLSFVPSEKDQHVIQRNSYGSKVHFQFFMINTIIYMLNKANFEVISAIPVSYNRSEDSSETHMVMLAKKTI